MTRILGPLLVATLAALAACGDTLVDHEATDIQQGPGFGVCLEGQVSCRVAGELTCPAEGPQFCGSSCTPCPDPAVAGATRACIGEGSGNGVCGYECQGGLLKCQGGCCTVSSVVAGARHTCAVTSGGGLFCWGDNTDGQVSGLASAAPVTIPVKRYEIGVVAVAAGEAHTCVALTDDVQCWGRAGPATPPGDLPVGVTALAAGADHTCALLSGGAVRCWGTGAAVGGGTPIAAGATAIAAGAAHTCAIVATGVKCWGANADGQLGDGSTTASPTPPTLPILTGIAAITARGNHTCAAAATPSGGAIDDALRCWGDGLSEFSLAAQQTTPGIPMRDATQSVVRFRVDRLSAGRAHFCVQKVGDQVFCFGPPSLFDVTAAGADGQLGGTPPAGSRESIPVPFTVAAKAVASGDDHSCAVFADDTVHCWGKNHKGQLGDGSTITPGVDDLRSVGTLVPVSGR